MQTADPIDEWRNTISQYEMGKSSLNFMQPPVKHVKAGEIKKIETMYNPILQQYSNPNMENEVRHYERESLIDTLAKNKDRALRYEQTFDVINFDDKLKGLEDKEGYPKQKGQNKNNKGGRKAYTDYNILSNLAYTEHHFMPPDQRPPQMKEKEKKNVKVTTTGLRDYNIVTNRYLELNDEKLQVDKEIERLNAAKKYWKTHGYDPVNIQYYDPEKEAEYQTMKKEAERTHGQDWVQKLPKSWKEEGGLYNPINGKIEDEKRLWERDLKEKNKRKRFELRYDMERQFHKQALGDEERNLQISLNKIDVQRFRDTTDRGFDIMTNKQFNSASDEGSRKLHEPMVKPPPSLWTKIRNTSNGFEEIHPSSSHQSSNRGHEYETNRHEGASGDDFDQKEFDSTQDEFRQTREIERRSKRLMKGSKTVTGFYKPKNNYVNPVNTNVNNGKVIYTKNIVAKVSKDIAPAPAAYNPATRETNQSALRKSVNVGGSYPQRSNVGSTASMTGRNIVATPKSSQASVVSSNRAIRTGAFQRIKS